MKTMLTTLLAVATLLLPATSKSLTKDSLEGKGYFVDVSAIDSLLTSKHHSSGDVLTQQHKFLDDAFHELRAQYEAEKLTIQKELQNRAYRNSLFLLTVIVALLCAIVIVVTVNDRKLRAKNRSLLNRIREHDGLEEKFEQLRERVALKNRGTEEKYGKKSDSDTEAAIMKWMEAWMDSETDIETENAMESGGEIETEMKTERKTETESESETELKKKIETEKNQDELYLKFRELMKDPSVFTDPNLNRKTIADKLGTNEKYVFMLVKEYYGTNISDYINKLRLSYARQLLILMPSKRTVDDIALEAGFNSRSAFYRLFKEYYGMTPVECRQYGMEMSSSAKYDPKALITPVGFRQSGVEGKPPQSKK